MSLMDELYHKVKKLILDNPTAFVTISEVNPADIQKKLEGNMATKKPKAKKKANPIFQWTFKSNQEVLGTRAIYSTLLREDKSLTCNCPGWIFAKKDKKTGQKLDRSCKHTRLVEGEAVSIYKKWKSGEKLPEFEMADVSYSSLPGAHKSSGIKYGRVLQLD